VQGPVLQPDEGIALRQLSEADEASSPGMGDAVTVERLSCVEDAPRLYTMLGRHFASRSVHKELGGPIYDDENTLWVVMRDSAELAAFGAVRIAANGVVWLDYAYVEQRYRGTGLHSRLLDERLRIAHELGAVRIRTVTQLAAVAEMFERRGFRCTSRRGAWSYYEGEGNHAVA
jgi:GNAT superfamily N-acetyltransferase